MKIDERELANLLERFWIRHSKFLQEEHKIVMPETDEEKEDYLMEITPTDMDYREYANDIISDIKKLKKWIY